MPYRWSTTWRHGSAGRVSGTLLLSLSLSGLFFLWPIAADPAVSLREITVVTRGMAFYVDGNDEPNPTLTMTAGETVRIVFKNEDAGIAHNFEVQSWDKMIQVPKSGRVAAALVDVPDRPGQHLYQCGPHSMLMNGVIEIVPAT